MADSITNSITQSSAAQVNSAIGTAKNNKQTEPAPATGDSAKLAQDFDDFLKLLTTQLQNQDPLDPTDTTEFTNQLVGFSQVEQQINLNKKMENLINITSSNSLQQALGYIGLQARYDGNQIYTPGDAGVSNIHYNLSDNVNKATLRIVDATGDTVYTADLTKTSGDHDFEWNGKDFSGKAVKAGTYKALIDIDKLPETSPKLKISVSSRVTGIESKKGETYLTMGDFAVPLSGITSADVPHAAKVTE